MRRLLTRLGAAITSTLLKTLVGPGFWGLSGTATQALFQTCQFPVIRLVMLRTLVSGKFSLRLSTQQDLDGPFSPLLGLSILRFVGSQLAYREAIQFSNAATSTLLQFLFLPIVASYEIMKGVMQWSVRWTVSVLLAMLGTLFLVAGVPGSSFRILMTPNGVLSGLLPLFQGRTIPSLLVHLFARMGRGGSQRGVLS